MEQLKGLYNGKYCEILAIERNGRCRVEEAIEAFAESDSVGAARLATVLNHLAEHGPEDLDRQRYEKCRNGGGIYEVKSVGKRFRLYVFNDSRSRRYIIACHYSNKKSGTGMGNKKQDVEINTAKKRMQKYKSGPILEVFWPNRERKSE